MKLEEYMIDNHIKSIRLARRADRKGKYYYPRLRYLDPVTGRECDTVLSIDRIPVIKSRAGNEQYYQRAKTLAETKAREFIKNLMNDAEQSKIQAADKRLYEVCDEWLEMREKQNKPKLAPSTISDYQNKVKYVKDAFPQNPKIHTITRDNVKAINQKYEKKSLATAKSAFAMLKRILKYAAGEDYITKNVLDFVDPPRGEKTRLTADDIFQKDEIKQLFEATKLQYVGCIEDMIFRFHAPVLLGAFFGLRREEALGMQWNDIDFDNSLLRVQHTLVVDRNDMLFLRTIGKSKTAMRTLKMPDKAKRKLMELREYQKKMRALCGNEYNDENAGYVCLDLLGNRIHPNYISGSFSKLCKRFGIRQLDFHSLRHYVATNLLRQGHSMTEVSCYMGHSSIQITVDTYGHFGYDFIKGLVSEAESLIE